MRFLLCPSSMVSYIGWWMGIVVDAHPLRVMTPLTMDKTKNLIFYSPQNVLETLILCFLKVTPTTHASLCPKALGNILRHFVWLCNYASLKGNLYPGLASTGPSSLGWWKSTFYTLTAQGNHLYSKVGIMPKYKNTEKGCSSLQAMLRVSKTAKIKRKGMVFR